MKIHTDKLSYSDLHQLVPVQTAATWGLSPRKQELEKQT